MGIVLGVIYVFLGFFIIYFFLVTIISFAQGNQNQDIFNSWIENQQVKAYEKVAGYWQENEFVKSLSYVCSFQKTEIEKVKCVHYYINSTYNYTNHGFGNQLRGSPEEIINKSGVCRDYSTMYASLMKNFNINYEFVHKPGHIYLKVYPDNYSYSCMLDMRTLRCYKKNNLKTKKS